MLIFIEENKFLLKLKNLRQKSFDFKNEFI